jgi:hypothetical protein
MSSRDAPFSPPVHIFPRGKAFNNASRPSGSQAKIRAQKRERDFVELP